MPQTARHTATAAPPAKRTLSPQAKADRDLRADVRKLVTGATPVSFPATDSTQQRHMRSVIERMRKGKGGLPYVVEASDDGTRVMVSLPAPTVTTPTPE
jgi:hypothetical protein